MSTSYLRTPAARAALWLALGAGLLAVSTGLHAIALAAWLAPIFLLRFTRTQPAGRGLSLALLAHVVVYVLAWRTMVPTAAMTPTVAGQIYLVLLAFWGLLHWLPFALDRVLTPRLRGLGWATTLIFPLAFTTVEYLNALVNPYTTWGSLAYSQAGNLPLLQLASVTGIWGVTFLITWGASVANRAWERGFDRPARAGILAYSGILTAVLLAGGARLVFFPPSAPAVTVAALAAPAGIADATPEGEEAFKDPAARARYSQVLDDYLERSRAQARAGARVVVWQENAVYAFEDDAPAYLARAQSLAREEGIYLLMTLGAGTPAVPETDLIRNQAIAIGPDGEVLFTYLKSLPPIGSPDRASNGRLPAVDTPFGRFSNAICYDMDQPRLIRQAGRLGADLLFDESWDWPEIAGIHTTIASFRGIENGASVVKATGTGLSAAFDYQGRLLASADYASAAGAALVAQVPVRGVRTIYAAVGDLFAWICVGALALLSVAAMLPSRRPVRRPVVA